MYHPSHRVERRFGDGLRQGRMCVDGQIDLFDGVLVLPSHGQLMNDLGGVATDDVGPRISPYFLSRMIFTNPSVSSAVRARPLALKGKRPT